MRYYRKNNTILENIQPNVEKAREKVNIFGLKSYSLIKIQHQLERKSRSTTSFDPRKIRQRN